MYKEAFFQTNLNCIMPERLQFTYWCFGLNLGLSFRFMKCDPGPKNPFYFVILRFIHQLKVEYIRFPLMYGLLGLDNI